MMILMMMIMMNTNNNDDDGSAQAAHQYISPQEDVYVCVCMPICVHTRASTHQSHSKILTQGGVGDAGIITTYPQTSISRFHGILGVMKRVFKDTPFTIDHHRRRRDHKQEGETPHSFLSFVMILLN